MTTGPPTSPLRHLVTLAGGGGRRELGARASWSMVIEVLQLASSVLMFVALARLLPKEEYGIMGGVLAVAAPAAALTTFGSHILLIKRVAQGGDLQHAWKRATSIGVLGPGLGAAVVIGFKPLILPDVNTWVYVLLVLSQLNFFWLSELAIFVGNATRRLKEAAQIRLLVVMLRLLAIALFALFGDGTLLWWAAASFLSFGLGALVSLVLIRLMFGVGPSLRRGTIEDLREGLPFSVNSGSESLVDVSDRALLTRYGLEADAAVYTVATRIIQFGYLPLNILMRASDADVFQAAKRGTGAALATTRRLLPPGIAVAAVVGLAILMGAPLIPMVVGPEYNDAVPAIRLLAVLPLIRSVQYLMGNCLSASGRQWWRLGATLAAFALNFGLNIRYLPSGTWRTAVYTTLVSEVFLTMILSALVLGWTWREGSRHGPAGQTAGPGPRDGGVDRGDGGHPGPERLLG